ncbi:hypothetical protein [Bradyrhizobium sp. Ash2021]|nr:hypothetical protein [Bradyrhizobium sp. Ash2021]
MKHLMIPPYCWQEASSPLARWKPAPSFALVGWFAQAASPPEGLPS